MKLKSVKVLADKVRELVKQYPKAVYKSEEHDGCSNVEGFACVDGEGAIEGLPCGCLIGIACQQLDGSEDCLEFLRENHAGSVKVLLKGLNLWSMDEDEDILFLCKTQEHQDRGWIWKRAAQEADIRVNEYLQLSPSHQNRRFYNS